MTICFSASAVTVSHNAKGSNYQQYTTTLSPGVNMSTIFGVARDAYVAGDQTGKAFYGLVDEIRVWDTQIAPGYSPSSPISFLWFFCFLSYHPSLQYLYLPPLFKILYSLSSSCTSFAPSFSHLVAFFLHFSPPFFSYTHST